MRRRTQLSPAGGRSVTGGLVRSESDERIGPGHPGGGSRTLAVVHDFAFQTGSWRVFHRKLARRLAGSDAWYEFEGRCRAWELMDGAGNVDDHELGDPRGAYRAASLRRCEPGTRAWTIWWWDSRLAEIGPPVHGSFADGIGTFL